MTQVTHEVRVDLGLCGLFPGGHLGDLSLGLSDLPREFRIEVRLRETRDGRHVRSRRKSGRGRRTSRNRGSWRGRTGTTTGCSLHRSEFGLDFGALGGNVDGWTGAGTSRARSESVIERSRFERRLSGLRSHIKGQSSRYRWTTLNAWYALRCCCQGTAIERRR